MSPIQITTPDNGIYFGVNKWPISDTQRPTQLNHHWIGFNVRIPTNAQDLPPLVINDGRYDMLIVRHLFNPKTKMKTTEKIQLYKELHNRPGFILVGAEISISIFI